MNSKGRYGKFTHTDTPTDTEPDTHLKQHQKITNRHKLTTHTQTQTHAHTNAEGNRSDLLMIFGEVYYGNERFSAEEGVVDGAVKEDVLFLRLDHVDSLLA